MDAPPSSSDEDAYARPDSSSAPPRRWGGGVRVPDDEREAVVPAPLRLPAVVAGRAVRDAKTSGCRCCCCRL